MAPEPNKKTKYDQRGQRVKTQINVAGNFHIDLAKLLESFWRIISQELPQYFQNQQYLIKQELLKLVKQAIKERLDRSLHNSSAYITLDKRQDPHQIESPSDIEVKHGKKPAVDLPPETTIQQIFDREQFGVKLLILGVPGSGKTTELLKLAETLVERAERAEQDAQQPIPVLFNLSSWKEDDISIKNWLIEQLVDRNPSYKIRRNTAKKLIETGQIIPLLDGLDELAAERQESCVQKINDFLEKEWQCYPLVVGSRIEEYNNYSTLLNLNNSIILKPLTDNQIKTYLTNIGSIELWSSIQADSILMSQNPKSLGLARIPLFLYIITASKDELHLRDWQRITSKPERVSCLFSAYIREMFDRPYKGKSKLTNKQTQQWLSWLSIQLIRENNTEFFRIEDIQPNWLKNEHKTIRWPELKYRLIIWAISGLFVFFVLGLCCFTIAFPIFGIKGALIVALVIGTGFGCFGFGLWAALCFGSLRDTIEPVSQLNLAFRNLLKLAIELSVTGSITWGILIAVSKIVPGFLTIYQNFAMFLGLNLAVILGLRAPQVEKTTKPNQEIIQSVKYSIFFAGWGVAVCASLASFVSDRTIHEFLGVSVLPKTYFVFAIALLGLFFGFSQAGIAAIQHLALRLILSWHGYIPWNYAAFLEYATDRLFLQRVGGGYRFLHGLLRDHFAQIYREPKR